MGLYCKGCGNWRNKFKAVVRERLSSIQQQMEDFLAAEQNRKPVNTKVVGYLCKKCSVKAVDAVKNRPFGLSWRDAFKWRDHPTALQAWKNHRLEREIALELAGGVK